MSGLKNILDVRIRTPLRYRIYYKLKKWKNIWLAYWPIIKHVGIRARQPLMAARIIFNTERSMRAKLNGVFSSHSASKIDKTTRVPSVISYDDIYQNEI